MRLSEAIRLGPTVCPAIYGPVFEDWGRVRKGEPCGACRMGATAFVAGYRNTLEQGEMFWWMRLQWPMLNTHAKHPVDGVTRELAGLIIGLHEVYRWSADQIADYVETIESKENHDLQSLAVKDLSGVQHETYAQPGGMD